MSGSVGVKSSQSYLQVSGLTLHLQMKQFAPPLWEQVRDWFSEKGEQGWLRAPFEVMTAEGNRGNCPRWKQVVVDGLSWLIFVLMVPADHPLVALWQAVDWAMINQLGQTCYKNSQRGQRAWAPAQMFALLVLLLVVPVGSETGLIRTVAITPLYRWFCGFSVLSPLPDHSSLYTFRQRLGVERFEAILTWVVGQCLKRGLISNELLFFDLMGVAASAHVWSPYERAVLLTQALIRYLERTEPGQEPVRESLRQLAADIAIEVLANKSLKKEATTMSLRVLKSLERWQHRRQMAAGEALWERSLAEAVQTVLAQEQLAPPPGADESARRHWLKQVAEALKANLPHARGDQHARVGWVSDVVLKCGYWVGFLADSWCQVITAVRVVPLNESQHAQMIPALHCHQQRCGAYPKAVAADSAQDYYPVHAALDGLDIEGHIASREHNPVGGGWGANHFTWNAAGQLRCPEGYLMSPGKPRASDGLIPHKATGPCATCRCQADCLPKGQQPAGPRLIYLDPAAHQRWQQNRAHCQTEAYKQAQAQRFASEGLFGLARRLHGADKMPYRSAAMNHIAGVLLGTVMNLALLARRGQTVTAG